MENNPALEKLLLHTQKDMGILFSQEDLTKIKDKLLASKVPAAACAGAIVSHEVPVPPHNTGLEPEKTSLFQALGITTKISRGTTETLSNVPMIKTGDKIRRSKATLRKMLIISPLSFELIISRCSTVAALTTLRFLTLQSKL